MILVTIILMDLLAGMEFDLFVPSFPQLQSHFGLSAFWVTALLSVNFVGYCLSLLYVGGLADRYGRKPIILLGVMIFVLGSILCLSPASYTLVLIGRLLQGVGIAAPSILSFLIIADSYSIKKQQFLMAMLNGSMNIAAAIAPIIGSYITMHFTWQGNFVALLVLGIITLMMTVLFIPTYKLPDTKQTLSLRGYKVLFQSKPLMLLMLNIVCVFVPYWIFVGMSSLLYLKEFGVSLSHFGYYQGVLALAFALGSVMYGLMLRFNNYEQKKMLHVAIWILLVSLIAITAVTFSDSANPLAITLALLTFVIAQIIPSTILYPLAMNFMPQAKGRASATIQGGRLIFSALALQIVGYFYVGSFRNIGIIISCFIVVAIITLFYIINNRELMTNYN